jgi:hypothetical protein
MEQEGTRKMVRTERMERGRGKRKKTKTDVKKKSGKVEEGYVTGTAKIH